MQATTIITFAVALFAGAALAKDKKTVTVTERSVPVATAPAVAVKCEDRIGWDSIAVEMEEYTFF
ncbi:hypothetical protein DDE83_006112 [Stemphylium lycopersici]|uniref:Uncharacterized protein n=1 Tax=Stemphylium lycopersici TaxID=183478 RepID=A0A364MZX5_STELY|nr:hypothetical protein DDE83_006112 [Stemphylium lycopersici]